MQGVFTVLCHKTMKNLISNCLETIHDEFQIENFSLRSGCEVDKFVRLQVSVFYTCSNCTHARVARILVFHT